MNTTKDKIPSTPRQGYKNSSRANKKKIRKKNQTGIKVFRIIFFILVIFFVVRMTQNGWSYGGFLATMMGHSPKTVENLEPVYIVVTGESTGLTDSIMLCKYNPKKNDATIISIPRDTFIGQNEKKATPSDKINTLYNKSPEKLLAEVNRLTGLNVKYYLNIDTKGLRELIDSIGGVYFDVPIDMDYDDPTQDLHIHLKAGYQLLNGDRAEQVVRFRHNNDGTSYPSSYGDNDLGRMKTQREFIKALAQQVAKKKSIGKINEYKKIIKNNVKTNYDIKKARNYIPYLVDFDMQNLHTTTLPGTPKLCNGVWLFIPDYSETNNIINEM